MSKSLDVTEIQLALSVVLIVTAVAGTEVRNLHFGDREVPETLDDSSSYYSGVGMRNVAVFLGGGGGSPSDTGLFFVLRFLQIWSVGIPAFDGWQLNHVLLYFL